MSLPNLDLHQVLTNSLLAGIIMPESGQTGEDPFVNLQFSPPHSDVLALSLFLFCSIYNFSQTSEGVQASRFPLLNVFALHPKLLLQFD